MLEICVDSLESALAAADGGAGRVELCTGLREGGMTPSLGLMRAVRAALRIPLMVMIRPRAGDFVYSAGELAIMRDDVSLAAKAGAEGVVLGLLTADRRVDVERTRALVELARPMRVTFHRAIDVVEDMVGGLEDVIRTGADAVLTSGGEATAKAGVARLSEMVRMAGGRIEVMVGGGVRPGNLGELAGATRATAFHSGVRRAVRATAANLSRGVVFGDAGMDEGVRYVVHPDDVRALASAMAGKRAQDERAVGFEQRSER